MHKGSHQCQAPVNDKNYHENTEQPLFFKKKKFKTRKCNPPQERSMENDKILRKTDYNPN